MIEIMIKRSILASVLTLLPSIAAAEVFIVTGSKSKIQSLTRTEAIALFLGYAPPGANISAGGLIDLPSGNVRDEFYFKLTGKSAVQMNAHWSRLVYTGKAVPPQEVRSVTEAKDVISNGINVIGYVSKTDLSTSNMRVLYVLQ